MYYISSSVVPWKRKNELRGEKSGKKSDTDLLHGKNKVELPFFACRDKQMTRPPISNDIVRLIVPLANSSVCHILNARDLGMRAKNATNAVQNSHHERSSYFMKLV